MPDISEISRIPLLIISDGKPGHENQSLGVAERIPHADIMMHRHTLRIGLAETFLRLHILLLKKPGMNAARNLLSHIFPESVIESVIHHQPRAIIAAGTLSAVPSLLFGFLTSAKTCQIMTPSMVPLKLFDLAVIPTHDNPPETPNILKTLAAPNRVSEILIRDEAEKWKSELPQTGMPVISWIVGGPSASAGFDPDRVLSAIEQTISWANKSGYNIWLSTARRTPVELENKIAKLKNKYKQPEWSLLWHSDQRNPLYAMFQRSKAAIVTSDSVSMIAEAASAGCGPIVFKASGSAGKLSKQDRMIRTLTENGYGKKADNSEHLVRILESLNHKSEWKKLNDTGNAVNRLLKLL